MLFWATPKSKLGVKHCHSYIKAGYSHKARHSGHAQLKGSAEVRVHLVVKTPVYICMHFIAKEVLAQYV